MNELREPFDPEKIERPYVKEWGHHAVYTTDYDQLLAANREQKEEIELPAKLAKLSPEAREKASEYEEEDSIEDLAFWLAGREEQLKLSLAEIERLKQHLTAVQHIAVKLQEQRDELASVGEKWIEIKEGCEW